MLSRIARRVVGITTNVTRSHTHAGVSRTLSTQTPFADYDFAAKHLAPQVVARPSILWTHGQGSYLFNDKGERFLDFTCGIGVTNTGHCHPDIVRAVQQQASQACHIQMNAGYHQPMIDLVKNLLPVLPQGLESLFFANSGAEAVENAVKIARYHTKKPNIITFNNSFHGRTFGAMSLTNSKTTYRSGFSPLLPGVFVAPIPYCSYCRIPKSEGTCCHDPLVQLEHILHQQTAPSETAAIIIEPVLGEGGVLVPPDTFLPALRDICTKNGILLIADEVQSGYGRTGKMFAVEHTNVVPDILVMAKGIASGYPLSAVATRPEIMHSLGAGAIGGTYGGSAVSCAAAVATLQVFEREGLVENARVRGEHIISGLRAIADDVAIKPYVHEVRGRGLFLALEFKTELKGIASQVVAECRANQLLTLTAGANETLRLLPPLIVTEQQANDGLAIVRKSIEHVIHKHHQQAK